MKTILLIIIFATSSFFIHADGPVFRGAAGIGLSNPIGEYMSTDLTENKSSAAKPGISFQATGALQFTDVLGFGAGWYAHVNAVDLEAVLDFASSLDSTVDWQVASTRYSRHALLLGPVFSGGYNSVSLDLSVMFGPGTFYLPEMTLTATDMFGNQVVGETGDVSGAGFTSRFGLDFSFAINSRAKLVLGIGIMVGEYQIKDNKTFTRINEETIMVTTENYTIPVRTLDVTIGVSGTRQVGLPKQRSMRRVTS